ncbi:MAG: flagellar hook-length control protein FliK [Alphaproteobacteria bacterium]
MKVFDIRSNSNFETQKIDNVSNDKDSNFSTLLNSSSSLDTISKASNGSFVMNFLTQTLDSNVVAQDFSGSNDVEVEVTKTKDKYQEKPEVKEKETVKTESTKEDNKTVEKDTSSKSKKVDDDQDEVDTCEVKAKPKSKNKKTEDGKDSPDNNDALESSKDVITQDISNEDVAENIMQMAEDENLISEMQSTLAAPEEVSGQFKNLEDGTNNFDDLLGEASASSMEGIKTENFDTPEIGKETAVKADNVVDFAKEVEALNSQAGNDTAIVSQVANVASTNNTKEVSDKNTSERKNLGVELASMSDDAITDKQAEALSEVLGEDIKAKVKVEVKDYTAQSSTKTENVAANVVNFGEEINAKAETTKTQETDKSSSFGSSDGFKIVKPVATGSNSENANMMTENQTATNANSATSGVAQTPSESFAEVLKTASSNINNITDGNSSKQSAQANDNIQGIDVVRGEKVSSANSSAAASKTQATTRQSMPSAVTEQIKVSINKAALKDADNINVQLKPKELGRIDVKMEISSDGKLSATISASRPETLDILQRDVRNLEKAFNDAGFKTDSGSLSFNFKGGQSSGQNQSSNNGSYSMTNLGADDAVQNFDSSDFGSYSLIGNGRGVNIKV